MTEWLIPLFIGVFFAQVSPGPNLMAVASVALGSGRTSGVMVAAGVASGVFIWAILFSLGLAALIEAFPGLITAMKLLGGGYLSYVAFRALKAAFRGSAGTIDPDAVRRAPMASYRLGLLVVLTNPKAALMWIAIAAFLASFGLSPTAFLVIGLAVSASAMAIYGTYAFMFSTGVATSLYRRAARIVEGLFGAMFGALGARLLFEGLREIRS